MIHFTPDTIEQNLVTQTRSLLLLIEARARVLSNATDVGAMMLLADQVADNVSALTGEALNGNRRDALSNCEAEYLFSRPMRISDANRTAIHEQMLKFTAAMRATLDRPKDEDVPF